MIYNGFTGEALNGATYHPHRKRRSGTAGWKRRSACCCAIGVLSSAAVILLGGVLFLMHHGRSVVDFTVFNSTPAGAAPPRLDSGSTHCNGNDLAIIQCGILMLIATPVARVAFSIFRLPRGA